MASQGKINEICATCCNDGILIHCARFRDSTELLNHSTDVVKHGTIILNYSIDMHPHTDTWYRPTELQCRRSGLDRSSTKAL